jgi:hypothetical protein
MLSEDFFDLVIRQIARPETVGITVSGSYARGDENAFSDVDLQHYVTALAEGESDYVLKVIDGHLVSIKTLTIAEERAALRKPHKAIWALPGLTQAKILLDKTGEVTALTQDAAQVKWSDLQSPANAYASEELMGYAEEAHKILGGLASANESAVLYAVWGMLGGLLQALAIQRGLMIYSENAYFDIVQDSAGRDSAWTRAFRTAAGLDVLRTDQSPYVVRGAAALALYRETVNLLRPILTSEHVTVVDFTLDRIASAGY